MILRDRSPKNYHRGTEDTEKIKETLNQLAEKVKVAGDGLGLKVEIKSVVNPRKESEDHYYNPKHIGLLDLGLKPNYLTDDVLVEMDDRRPRTAGRPG